MRAWRKNKTAVCCSVTHLHILKTILCANHAEHILLTAFLHLAGEEQFIKDEVGLLEVEDDVQLAHVAVVLVHLFYVAVNNLERDELVIRRVGGGDEEERGISTVYDFGV